MSSPSIRTRSASCPPKIHHKPARAAAAQTADGQRVRNVYDDLLARDPGFDMGGCKRERFNAMHAALEKLPDAAFTVNGRQLPRHELARDIGRRCYFPEEGKKEAFMDLLWLMPDTAAFVSRMPATVWKDALDDIVSVQLDAREIPIGKELVAGLNQLPLQQLAVHPTAPSAAPAGTTVSLDLSTLKAEEVTVAGGLRNPVTLIVSPEAIVESAVDDPSVLARSTVIRANETGIVGAGPLVAAEWAETRPR